MGVVAGAPSDHAVEHAPRHRAGAAPASRAARRGPPLPGRLPAAAGRPVWRADVAFTRQRVAVFVDGCYWHGCPEHGPKKFGTNAQFWTDKIAANRDRDAGPPRLVAGAVGGAALLGARGPRRAARRRCEAAGRGAATCRAGVDSPFRPTYVSSLPTLVPPWLTGPLRLGRRGARRPRSRFDRRGFCRLTRRVRQSRRS